MHCFRHSNIQNRANNAPVAGRILLRNNERRPSAPSLMRSFLILIIEHTPHHLPVME
jgi:hypothetical protein